MTEVKGRRLFQLTHLWSSSKADDMRKNATTVKYDVQKHGAEHGMPPKLPTAEEAAGNNSTKEYLEVGLVIGGEPSRWTSRGQGGQASAKKRATEQKARGVLTREETAMRVFIRVEDRVAPKVKFYVGCLPQNGRLHPRVIKFADVFIYAEFWRDVADGLNARVRQQKIGKALRMAAARDKNPVRRTQTRVVELDAVRQQFAQYPLTVSKKEDMYAHLIIKFWMYETTGNKDYVKDISAFINKAAPILPGGPRMSDDGVAAFLEDTGDFTEADAVDLRDELKVL